MNIGLNAHLLSTEAGYRSAGIHGYIYNTLSALPGIVPSGVQLTAMVGSKNRLEIPGVTMERARTDTRSPARRVVWEQTRQPFLLDRFDLYHALAFIAPVLPYQPPTIVTIYDLSFIHYPGVLSPARRAYLSTLTRLTVRRASRVVAISESTAQDVAQEMRIPRERVTVAYPGVNRDQYRPLPQAELDAFRAEHDLAADFWLFLGTLEPRKNLPTLLEAYAQLPPGTRPPLVLGGGLGWDYEPIFDTIARHRLEDDVRLPGYIPAADLPLWYNSASVFLYPSIYEGFGIPPLEAMACGTPVIVSDASSLPEVVAGTDGLLVPPTEIGAWQAALTRALDDSEWRVSAGESGHTGAARFTWEAAAHEMWAAYQHVLG